MREDDGDKTSEQFRQKKILGEQLRKDFDDMHDLIEEATKDKVPIPEWFKLADVWMQRQETKEAFHRILGACEDNPEVYGHPSESKVFKRMFLQIASVDIGLALSQNFKDVYTWLAFQSGGAQRRGSRRRVTPMEAIGLR